jgi:hypothetical protein
VVEAAAAAAAAVGTGGGGIRKQGALCKYAFEDFTDGPLIWIAIQGGSCKYLARYL